MKPLTIEELKKLEVGDWVWIVGLVYKTGFYIKKQATNIIEKEYTFYGVGAGGYDYADYGTMWLAYKNKEQAESKQDSINILEAENERLHDYKCKLEKELTERGFAEYAHGNFRLLSDEEKEEVRKDTAKDIIYTLLVWAKEEKNVLQIEQENSKNSKSFYSRNLPIDKEKQVDKWIEQLELAKKLYNI